MAAETIEFDYEGRTYRIKDAFHEWNIYAINARMDKVSLEHDDLTGEDIFVSWGKLGVLRRLPME